MRFFLLLSAGLAMAGCGQIGHSQDADSKRTKRSAALTPEELRLCDSTRFDPDLALSLRLETDSALLAFPSDLDDYPPADSVAYARCQKIPGLLVYTPSKDDAQFLVTKLRPSFHREGYTIFEYDDQNPKPGRMSSCVGVLATTDQLDVLRRVQTDGANYSINNDSLVRLVRRMDNQYSLSLVGAGRDWCEFAIGAPAVDWARLGAEAYKVCPDIVDQGTGTVGKLTDVLRQTKHLYFWWD